MPNLDGADIELELWRQFNGTARSSSGICEVLKNTAEFFPNLQRALKVLLTMPTSTASAEQSFSVLRCLKRYLHNTMTDYRLTRLALMNIHPKKLKSTARKCLNNSMRPYPEIKSCRCPCHSPHSNIRKYKRINKLINT